MWGAGEAEEGGEGGEEGEEEGAVGGQGGRLGDEGDVGLGGGEEEAGSKGVEGGGRLHSKHLPFSAKSLSCHLDARDLKFDSYATSKGTLKNDDLFLIHWQQRS